MKRTLALLLTLLMVLSLAACAPQQAEQPQGNAEPETPAGETVTLKNGVTVNSMVNVADESFNDMGADELYELAKKETGSISVYSETSTIGKVADAFMQDFPGLTVETYTLTPAEIQEKVKTEQETGNVTADVIIVNDAAGSIYNEWYPDDYVQAYYPTDIVSHVAPERLSSEMPLYEALNIWFYNTAQFPDGSPINNWWDIIEKDENGNQKYHIYCKNISGDTQYMSFYANMLNHADELEQAYFDKYGKELEYTYDASAVAVPENNAVYEFLYRFAQLEVGYISDGDEIMKAVAEATEPTLGFATANKLDQRDENNWPLAWVTQMKPFASQSAPKNLYLVSKTDNPAGSRLLMYYLLGGKNADTAALEKFSRLGCWFFRDDYTDTANEISLDEISIVQIDKTKVYETYLTLNDFWVYWNDYFA